MNLFVRSPNFASPIYSKEMVYIQYSQPLIVPKKKIAIVGGKSIVSMTHAIKKQLVGFLLIIYIY